jgi:ankyrin repeat protein
LHWALQEGRLEAAQLLLERGADPNALDGSGRTPFGWALQEGRLDIVQLLLKRGENVDIRDKSHRTPLHWAF